MRVLFADVRFMLDPISRRTYIQGMAMTHNTDEDNMDNAARIATAARAMNSASDHATRTEAAVAVRDAMESRIAHCAGGGTHKLYLSPRGQFVGVDNAIRQWAHLVR